MDYYESLRNERKKIKTLTEAKAVFTDEEIVFNLIDGYYPIEPMDIKEGDERIVTDILEALKGLSVEYSSHLLDVTKAILPRIVMVDY